MMAAIVKTNKRCARANSALVCPWCPECGSTSWATQVADETVDQDLDADFFNVLNEILTHGC